MGQRDLFLTLFGIRELTGGEIRLRGEPVRIASPRDAIRAGIGLVPEDRKTEGLFLGLTGGENASLPSLDRFSRFGLVGARQQDAAARAAFSAVQLAERALWSPARLFSGGNQQKIVLAKWLLTGSRILLLYDPTRGVDVGTKAEIYALMRRFVEAGGTILFYSTEIAELVNMCDDVLVLYRGRVASRLSGPDITETAIMRSALGGPAKPGELHDHAR
jgi:ribose transport system ATP-binding protein